MHFSCFIIFMLPPHNHICLILSTAISRDIEHYFAECCQENADAPQASCADCIIRGFVLVAAVVSLCHGDALVARKARSWDQDKGPG